MGEVITVKRKRYPDFEELMKREGGKLFTDAEFRRLLGVIHDGCYVECEGTGQHGNVTGIIRDRYGIPVAAKVKYEEEVDGGTQVGIDYIAMADVTFWEPYNYDEPVQNYEEMIDLKEDCADWAKENGYVWNDERCCYIHPKTGDVIAW